MGGLLSYSGITTKVRAMESHLITDRQFGEMSTLESVSDAVEYLRRLPAYGRIFSFRKPFAAQIPGFVFHALRDRYPEEMLPQRAGPPEA